MNSEILAPVVVLAIWSMFVWLIMYATRIPAMGKAGIKIMEITGGTGKDLDKFLPAKTQWKAQNYNHLMEQPTIFYAVAISLAVLGAGGGLNAQMAWTYVALRIGHSLVQITINRIWMRFLLFLLSSAVLIALAIRAGLLVFEI